MIFFVGEYAGRLVRLIRSSEQTVRFVAPRSSILLQKFLLTILEIGFFFHLVANRPLKVYYFIYKVFNTIDWFIGYSFTGKVEEQQMHFTCIERRALILTFI